MVFSTCGDAEKDFDAALKTLCSERLLAATAADEYSVRGDERAMRHWEAVAAMFLPIIEAYWAVAVQALTVLPACGGAALPRAEKAAVAASRAMVLRLRTNIETLVRQSFVAHAEAASTELVANALRFLLSLQLTQPVAPSAASPDSAPEFCICGSQVRRVWGKGRGGGGRVVGCG